jgi:hypothetical protein
VVRVELQLLLMVEVSMLTIHVCQSDMLKQLMYISMKGDSMSEEKVEAPEYVREEDICLCGELIAECKDAYDHMAKGY